MRAHPTTFALLPIALLGVAAPAAAQDEPAPEQPVAEGAPAPETGVVRGRVTFAGPAPGRVAIHADHVPRACGRGAPTDDSAVVGPDGGLANVALFLKGVTSTPLPAPSSARLRQHGCVFSPRVQTVEAGTVLEITNDDPMLHNVHALSEGHVVFNIAMPIRGLRSKRTLRDPGVVTVRCDIHSWMKAYVVVVPHAFHATSDMSGGFRIEGVPPGTYTLIAWHERFGSREVEVTVTGGGETEQPVAFEPPAAEVAQGQPADIGAELRGGLEQVRTGLQSMALDLRRERRARVAVEGRALFLRHCATCHGTRGDGRGRSARFLDDVPRDFTRGEYEFRQTPSGTLARVEDVFRTITTGLPGTAMPSWERVLSRAQRIQIAEYLMTLSPRFEAEGSGEPIDIPREPRNDEGSVARGRAEYLRMQCAQCHGPGGRGDGPTSAELKDDWGNRLLPWDFTQGFYQGGRGAAVVYRAFSTGLSGTPMPSYADALAPAQRWDLVHYVQSLTRRRSLLHDIFGAPAGRTRTP
jgi:cytochrome c oxidase cbb3-type subunit 2